MKDAQGHGSNGRGTGTQGMRLQKSYTSPSGNYGAKVYSNPEWGEHVVKFTENGTYNAKADYHTDDKKDAHDTAQYALARYDRLDANRDSAAKALASGPKSNPVPTHDAFEHSYNRDAVQKAIDSSNRRGPKISGGEAKKIHALLKGWRG